MAVRRRDTAAGPAPKVKVDLRNIEFYYGKFKALHGITLPLYDRRVTAFVGPSGCGKSTLAAHPEPHLSALSGSGRDRRGADRRRRYPRPRHRSESAARQGRDGVPEADAVSDVDLRQYRLRHPALRKAAEIRARRPGRSGAARRGAVGRGQGQIAAERAEPVGRPAAASVHRARDRDPPGDPAARRAGLGARPDLDAAHRGTDRRVESTIIASRSSPTTCSRRRARRTTRPSCISAS